MQIVITDVTEMSSGIFCVAGWEPNGNRMIRPLPNGANWTKQQIQQHHISPGSRLDVRPLITPHNGDYPHQTEDTRIDAATIQFINGAPFNWHGNAAPFTHPTVQAIFGGQLQQNSIQTNTVKGAHVLKGVQSSSLGAVSKPRASIRLYEHTYYDKTKLRVEITDGHLSYDLAVSSSALKTAWRNGGLAGAIHALPTSPNLHLRLGLARAFGDPPTKCYLMLNGVHG